MQIRLFRWLFVSVLMLQIVSACVFAGEGRTLGASVEWTKDSYEFAGGTAPGAVGFAVVIAWLYFLLMDSPPLAGGKPLPSVLRRLAAFWIDFVLAISVIAPMVGFLPLLVEWGRTRMFAWTFTRATPAAFDIPVTIVSVVLGAAGLLFYYAIPVSRHRPSPGACVLGYQVLSDDGAPLSIRRAVYRSLLGFIAVSGAYFAPFIGRDQKQGKFWLDRVFGTSASLLP